MTEPGTPANAAPATLIDVAREAGVSLATASRVLNGSTRKVSEDYGVRVRAAAEKLRYSTNLSAQATARGTSAIVALLVADIADPYFGEIASGVVRGADEAALTVTIGMTQRDQDREIALARALRGQRPRGVILTASRTSTTMDPELRHELELIEANGGRVVVFGSGGAGFREVSLENHLGSSALGEALAAQGYTDAIALVAEEGVVTSDRRLAGFTHGFTGGGGAAPRVYRGTFTRESGEDMMLQALADGVAPGTVVWGLTDVVAIGAMAAIRAAGREPGADIAVAGFDDIPTGRDVTPTLTTVGVPLGDLGYRALRACVDAEWDAAEPLSIEVLLRDSTPARS